MITVTLYTRRDCPLCEEAKADLEAIQAEVPHRLVEIFIDDNPDLFRQYGDRVPVIEAGPYRKFPPFTREQIAVTLRAARDRQESLERAADADYLEKVKRGQKIDGTDKFTMWMTKNYIWVINLMLFLYVGFPFLAPTLMKVGMTIPARAIYLVYSPLCHQLAFRSWFLYGEQSYYPRSAAGIEGVMTYGEASGLDENDLLAARNFTGNEVMGYKVAICERDIAIYAGMLLFGIFFALFGRNMKPLPWWIWILVGIVPIALDGFSQLFSQLGIPGLTQLLPYRESTPFLRTLTGLLFGITTAWFGFPYIEESMVETRQTLTKKFAVAEIKSREQSEANREQ
jgi:uncharacterized membrane protein